MSLFRSLFAHHEAKAAFAVWALVPTLFLFFTITLAVDPTTQLNKVRLGVAVLDKGVQTPQGVVSAGSRLAETMQGQLPVQIVPFATEGALRDAVLAHEVAGGVVIPETMTQNIQTKQPVELRVVKSDANDPFTNAMVNNLSTQLAANLNAALPALMGGQPTPPLVSVKPDPVAATTDFRFPMIPATLVLPLWIATLAFAALMSRAGDKARRASGAGVWEMGLVEATLGIVGAAITAAVITLDIALFTWHWDLEFLGLFGFLWLGMLAASWLLLGTIRLFGFELGVALGVLALFIQQPVSGATMPPSFAPDIVRWAEGVAPLRYLVEGMRNLLIGGSTTDDMAFSLGLMAGAGLVLMAAGAARLSLMTGRERHDPQTAPAA